MAHNFRNNYETALDSYGNMWQNDNDDQVVACRTSWLMEGANAGYFSSDGTRYWQGDQRPGQPIPTAHWHQEDPGVMPAGDITGAGSPTGMVMYEGDDWGRIIGECCSVPMRVETLFLVISPEPPVRVIGCRERISSVLFRKWTQTTNGMLLPGYPQMVSAQRCSCWNGWGYLHCRLVRSCCWRAPDERSKRIWPYLSDYAQR